MRRYRDQPIGLLFRRLGSRFLETLRQFRPLKSLRGILAPVSQDRRCIIAVTIVHEILKRNLGLRTYAAESHSRFVQRDLSQPSTELRFPTEAAQSLVCLKGRFLDNFFSIRLALRNRERGQQDGPLAWLYQIIG